ncbi:unnamed protein product [Ceutorhynchus assimilis]|uniref:Uncharacterized protein n=1 Tax=Ceutorhynchus assimilis TaxID=467358 RepID=A0A9N9MSW2_9CUCU|nr:unnamed protein product [Ceutorhynchus assimilis]
MHGTRGSNKSESEDMEKLIKKVCTNFAKQIEEGMDKKLSKLDNVPSVTKPIHSLDKQQVPEPPICSSKTSMTTTESEEGKSQSDSGSDELVDFHEEPHRTQSELDDLVRDLHLSKSKGELLGSRLQQWRLLAPNTRVSIYRTRSK